MAIPGDVIDQNSESGGNKKRSLHRPRFFFTLYIYFINLGGVKWT